MILSIFFIAIGVESFPTDTVSFRRPPYTETARIRSLRPIHRSASTSLHDARRGTELSRYKTRAAILQYTLQKKQKEYKLQDSKLQILQSVIKKLQSSNKNLLEKIKELQQERDGMHVRPQSDEIWPPDLEFQVIKEEFRSKEVEWENALNMARVKYQKIKSRYLKLAEESMAKDADIAFYQDRSKVDESEISFLTKEVEQRDELIAEIEKEKEELQEMLEKQKVEMSNVIELDKEKSSSGDDIEHDHEKLKALQIQVDALTAQNAEAKAQLLELGSKWKSRREEMELLILKEQDKILALQEQLHDSEIKEQSLKEQYEKLSEEFKSFQNSTQLASTEKENLAKQMSKESLEIATAAVRQAEEKERSLKKKLKRAIAQLEDSKTENGDLSNRVSDLESQLEQVQELKQKENEASGLVKKLKMQIKEIENSESAEWEKRLSIQEADYNERIEELQLQIQELKDSVEKDETREIVVLPVQETSRLRRFANRIKSVVKK